MPSSLLDPVASLPCYIFQAGTAVPEVQDRAYASALVLLIIVLLVNIVSRILERRFSKYVVK